MGGLLENLDRYGYILDVDHQRKGRAALLLVFCFLNFDFTRRCVWWEFFGQSGDFF